MKYQCEICGAVFGDYGKCGEHEHKCRQHYEGIINLTDELSALIGSAQCRSIILGVEVPKLSDDKPSSEFFVINGVEFKAEKNKVILHVKQNETKPETAVKPVKKS